jgi:RNA polymerase sigma-70 factor (ECF subfamily)
MVYNLALRITRDADDAAVVLQETFLRVFSALPRFRGRSRLETWVYRIAVNEALKRVRDRRRDGSGPAAQEPVSLDTIEEDDLDRDYHLAARMMTDDPQSMLENRELAARLEDAIGELPPKHRVAFLLVDVEGLQRRDAAGAAGTTVAALKTNLHRARLYLRDRMADYLEGKASMERHGDGVGRLEKNDGR